MGSDAIIASLSETKPTVSTGVAFPWFAVQVRSRYEMKAANHLDGQGYESFLPLYKLRRKWSDRIKEIDSPLFPGYLFCRFNVLERLPILKAPGVIQVVGFGSSPIPVADSEISALQALMKSGVRKEPWPFLKAGTRVRIESGPLVGLEGLFVESKGNHRFVLSVALLQRSVAVEIDSALVQVLQASQH